MMKVDNYYQNAGFTQPTSAISTGGTGFSSKLQAALKSDDEKKLYKACQELEAVFLNTVMQVMRQSVPKSTFLQTGFADETFQSMLDEEYANNISKTNSLGISQVLYKQLSSQIK